MAKRKRTNVGDEQEVQSRTDKIKHTRDTELVELRRILADKGGRNFIYRLLNYCGLYKDDRGLESSRLHERAGERGIANWVLAEVFEADPNSYASLIAEGAARDLEKEKNS